MAVSQDGRYIYAALTDNAISVLSRNSTSGELSIVQTIKHGTNLGDNAINIEGAYSIQIAPPANQSTVENDGGHVYVASATDERISVFSRNSSTGELTFVESKAVTASALSVSVADGSRIPDRKYDDKLHVYSRNQTTSEDYGKLTILQTITNEQLGQMEPTI